MDALTDERGQAAIFAVFLIAVAAVALGGLRLAQSELLARAVQHRAGEAAVEAAASVVADAYASELRARLDSSAAPQDMRSVLGDARLAEAARSAASELSLRNGGSAVSLVEVHCDAGAVAVTLSVEGSSYRAGFAADECSQR